MLPLLPPLLQVFLTQPSQWREAEQTWLAPDANVAHAINGFCERNFPCVALFEFINETTTVKIIFYLSIFALIWRGLAHLSVRVRNFILVSLLVCAPLADLIGNLIKKTTIRLRPLQSMQLYEAGAVKLSYSFPSNHAINMWTLATLSWVLFTSGYLKSPWIHRLCALAALLVSLGRVATGRHYPSDVAAGALIGSIFAFASLNFCLGIGRRYKILTQKARS